MKGFTMLRILLPILVVAGLSRAEAPEVLSAPQSDSVLRSQAAKPGFHLLDVRTPEEFAQGHLKGAVLVDVKSPDFETNVAKLPRKDRYLLYCRSGHRSGVALEKMKEMGFTNLQHVAGGIGAWGAAGLPTVQ
jgi:phage shock protein E